MTYSEALEQQIELAQWVASAPRDGRFTGQVRASIERCLLTADPIYVEQDFSPLIQAAGTQLPPTQLCEPLIPCGFAWFARPLAVPATPTLDALDPYDASSQVDALQAISWITGPTPWSTPGAGKGIFIVYWGHVRGRRLPWPGQAQFWGFGESWNDFDKWDGSYADLAAQSEVASLMAANRQLLHAFLLFIEQRIFVSSMSPAERAVRKRAERAGWADAPLVRVIKLRRAQSMNGITDAAGAHEWSCQWVVRGHWRQQFYPSKHANQPLWITPYVKGPEDKPLKPPRATVFAVVR